MPQHSPTMATLRPYCVSFYRINPAKSLIMQDKLTTSPLPLTPPDTGAEKQAHDVLWKNRMKLTFCQRSKWKCVPQQIPCSGRLGKDTRLQEYMYTHNLFGTSLAALHIKCTFLVCISMKWQSEVGEFFITQKLVSHHFLYIWIVECMACYLEMEKCLTYFDSFLLFTLET